MSAPGPLPEVRQCADITSPSYGATAVNAGNNRWGVMNPATGGHWATDADVTDWKVLA